MRESPDSVTISSIGRYVSADVAAGIMCDKSSHFGPAKQ